MVQGDLRQNGERSSIRMKVGEVGELTTREARAKAKVLLGAIAAGEDPRATRRAAGMPKVGQVPTLRQAWARYKVSHLERKNRSDQTIKHYEDHVERLLAAWLDEPLDKFGEEPALAAARHEEMTRDNGPAIANGAMRSFRAIYIMPARPAASCRPRTRPSRSTGTPKSAATPVLGFAICPSGSSRWRRCKTRSVGSFTYCLCCQGVARRR